MYGLTGNNIIQVIGRIGSDPTVSDLPSGNIRVNFNVATDETWRDQNGEQKKRTEWHHVVAWHPVSKYVNACHLKKGDCVQVIGKMEYGTYVDRNGQQRDAATIRCEIFSKLKSIKGGEDPQEQSGEQTPPEAPADSAEDLPF